MSYTYSSFGAVFSVSDCGGEEVLLGAYNEVFGTDLTTIEEIDDTMMLGDYCSPDSLDEAEVNGYEVDAQDGVFVYDMEQIPQDTIIARNVHSIMSELLGEGWQDDSSIVGDYRVVVED